MTRRRTYEIKKELTFLLAILALLLFSVLFLKAYKAVPAHADTKDTGVYAAETYEDKNLAETLAADTDEEWIPSDDYLFLKAFSFAIIMGLVILVLYVVFRWVALRQVRLFRRYELVDYNNGGAPDKNDEDGKKLSAKDPHVKSSSDVLKSPTLNGCVYALGIAFGCVFAALGAYLATFLPMYSDWNATGETLWLYLLIAIPAFLMFACYVPVVVNSYKHSKKVTAVLSVLASIFAAACVVCYCVFIPNNVIALPTKILTSLITLATELLAVTFIIPLDRKYEKPTKLATERQLYLAK